MAKQALQDRRHVAVLSKQEDQRGTSDTPLWDMYYQRIRKGIRFPRYYKKQLNW